MTASEVTQILTGLARVEAQVTALHKRDDDGESVHEDHESRIRSLERWRYLATGLAAGAGAATGSTISRLLGS